MDDTLTESRSASPPQAHPVPDLATMGLDDLAQIVHAYDRVTQKLQQSHEALSQEVLRLQQQLASTNAQLQRSRRLAALGEMAAGIAHEIRNPLAAIQLYAQMLVDDLPDGEQRQTAGKIGGAVRGLDAVVNDVLSFARGIQPRPRWIAAHAAFQRALDTQRHAIDAAGVHASLDVQPHDLLLWADPDLLHQALVNLIRNAVEAMEPDGGPLRLSAAANDELVTLRLHDGGPGIAEDDVDRIFNPFFTTRPSGTGLGLAIVHRIVDAHAGAIAVHNNHGAVFQLSLPLPADHARRRVDVLQGTVT